MKLKEFLNEDKVYKEIENEIREWVENAYSGLSIEFYPHLELVRTNILIDFEQDRVKKITEAVNIKIGDILETHAEEIYIAERLTRIWQKHPRFNIDINNIEELKKHPLFLRYLKELIIKPQNQDYRRKEVTYGKC